MKQFSPLQLKLLHLLSDGECHSGSILGEQLGVSRTAVWKQVNQLADLGLDVKRASLGYQLKHPIIPLDEQLIRQYLGKKQTEKNIHFHLFSEIDSTNQFLKELATKNALVVCCAEKQTKGRGRFGRQWYSPFGENIYFSCRFELNCCLSSLSGLSLVVGLSILASLRNDAIVDSLHLKWPNDVLWGSKKLAGILIEVIAETNSCVQLIIGIGINVNTVPHQQPLVDKPWCSLYEITGKLLDRNRLLASLIQHLNAYLDKLLQSDFTAFMEEWQELDYLQGQFISVSQPSGIMSGQALGVNNFGQLSLRDEQGKMHYLSSGDTSLNGL